MSKCSVRRNYGMGKHFKYAALGALKERYGNGRYGTAAAHMNRVARVAADLKEGFAIDDAREITIGVLKIYAEYLAARVVNEQLSISYGVNLISTLNEAMKALRGDSRVWVSPSVALGFKRTYVRSKQVVIDPVAFNEVVADLKSRGYEREALVVRSCRLFGLRKREVCLFNYRTALLEAEVAARFWITRGTKGGAGKTGTRSIQASSDSIRLLEKGAALQGHASNLIPTGMSLIQFVRALNLRVMSVLKSAGIPNVKELRAIWVCDRMRELQGRDSILVRRSGSPSNLESVADPGKLNEGEAIDQVMTEIGHRQGRRDIIGSYYGKRLE